MSAVQTLTLLVAALFAVVAYFYWMKYKKLRRTVDKIPGPTGTIPIIGDLQIMRQDLAGYFLQVSELCRGNSDAGIVRFWMGPFPLVLLFKARVVQDLLNSSKHSEKTFVYRFGRQWIGDGLLVSTGSKWFARRKLITPCFHFKILEEFIHVFNEQATVLVSHLDKMADGPAFDVRPFLYRCTLDIICEAAMGVKLNTQNDSSSSFLHATDRIMSLIIHRMKSPWLLPDVLHKMSPTGRELSQHLSVVHSFTAQVISDRRAAAATHVSDVTDNTPGGMSGTTQRRRLALLDMLLEQANIDSTLQTDKDIQEEVDTFMFAGHDTTAVASTWSLYMLGSHRDVQTKVQQELDSVLGDNVDRELTMEDIHEMKYLDCFMKETLRLYPPAPWFSRLTSETCKLGGYTVPRGCYVGVFLMQLHRDPEFFPDPDKFDPDRWLTDDIASRHPFCYIPFSAGMRNCVGQKFAVLEVKTLLCHILRQYNVLCNTRYEDMVAYAVMTLAPLKPIDIQLEKRQIV